MSLVILLSGVLAVMIAVAGYAVPSVRRVESILSDHDAVISRALSAQS
jgi:hypothetical protein